MEVNFLGLGPRIPVPGSANEGALSCHWPSHSGNMYNESFP
jgi:hypothetical protein